MQNKKDARYHLMHMEIFQGVVLVYAWDGLTKKTVLMNSQDLDFVQWLSRARRMQPDFFFFQLHTTTFLTTVLSVPEVERGGWVTQFAIDLARNKSSDPFTKQIIAHAKERQNQAKKNGRKGAEKRHNSSDPTATLQRPYSDPIAKVKVKVKVKEEVKEEKIDIPTWMPIEEWNDFVQNRIKLKKPMTLLAMKQAIKKLDNLRSVYSPAKVLSRATFNGWQDLYTDDSCKESNDICVTESWR